MNVRLCSCNGDLWCDAVL